MKHIFIILLYCGLLVACGTGAATGPTAQSCGGMFEATVHQGSNAGLSVTGNLQIQVSQSGRLTGALVRSDGVQIIASGQTIGQAINMFFDLGSEQHVFGVGTLSNDIQICQGLAGGLLTGPKSGDSGDWRWTPGR